MHFNTWHKICRPILIIHIKNIRSTISVNSYTSKKHWHIHVKNTGTNIDDTDKERIFEHFYRASVSRASETSVYGLGLAIAKQIIEDHQGTIIVEDNHSNGVNFIICLRKNYD